MKELAVFFVFAVTVVITVLGVQISLYKNKTNTNTGTISSCSCKNIINQTTEGVSGIGTFNLSERISNNFDTCSKIIVGQTYILLNFSDNVAFDPNETNTVAEITVDSVNDSTTITYTIIQFLNPIQGECQYLVRGA